MEKNSICFLSCIGFILFMPIPESISAEYLHGIDIYIWIASVIVTIGGFFIFYRKAKHTENLETLQKLYYAYANLGLSMGLNRTFFTLAYFTESMDIYFLFLGIGYVFAVLSFTPIIFVLEIKMLHNKSKYLFSISSIVILILAISSIFLPDRLYEVRTLIQGLSLIPGVIFFFLYGLVIKKTTGAPRRKAIKFLISAIVAISGYLLDSESILTLGIIPFWVAPFLFLTGAIFIIYSANSD